MANVTMRRANPTFTGNGDELYPKTLVAQIEDLSTIGANLLNLSAPAGARMVEIAADGSINLIDADTLKGASYLDAASVGHGHVITDIAGLDTELQGKAGVDSAGKLLAAHIPDYLLHSMKFHKATDATFINAGNLDLTLMHADLPGTTETERKGYYFVVHQDISLVAGSEGSVIQAPGDEGEYTLPITIEAGDYIMYIGENGADHEWAIINNTYRLATNANKGVVQISPGGIYNRANLNNDVGNALKVVDENALKDVMKDIHYGGSLVGNGNQGDLWFDGTF